jgi:Family of unknown function (DUF6252)
MLSINLKNKFMKSIMKFSAMVACILLLFAGCSKPKDFSDSYLKGKLNGVSFECNANISANKPEPIPGTGSDPTIRIYGEWPTHSIKLLIIGEGSSITTGSYVFQADKTRTAKLIDNNVDYYAGNSCTLSPPQLLGRGRITILEISDKYIKGTFEFITEVDSSTGVSKTVTDGEFYIKRS